MWSEERSPQGEAQRKHSNRAIPVLLYEWFDAGAEGAISGYDWPTAQKAKFDERIDRILELRDLKHESIQGLIYPFDGQLKKMKIRGSTAVRPILILGPEGLPEAERREITFLLVTEEKDGVLLPSPKAVKNLATRRIEEIRADPKRRRKYEQD